MLASFRFLIAATNALLQLALLGAVRCYQWWLSPVFGQACRYSPTCSNYALQALRRYGPWRGGWKSLTRLLRCHPWGGGGSDPP
ncbi:membrane protein insertion efficiency factor YidD [Botrimarina hoheduenensis]|uniref:Putative membrane protein insertion efficiency factor n=1 Tax=Botrimarina hoheduenensis TaxID=2528000 RepID=A0A5C5WCG6_9BACT|nr:membrane protein insertion efficiency factor YidD [Botrimarina hoheduenensis]TWT48606.1 putative membrane protein insertion efficiency factor [Botrimarina hoheduenensis]